MIYSKMWNQWNILAMQDTYNLDAVSPRITNKNNSQIICSRREKENYLIARSEKTT